MIAQLKGHLIESRLQKDHARLLVDVQGVGYEILVGLNAVSRIPAKGEVCLSVFHSVTPYDGSSVLYGFPSSEERGLFIELKEHVPGIGPKKALESLDRIMKSLPDFKRAIMEKDIRLLVGVFGFARKTAEKLVYALRDRMENLGPLGKEKWARGAVPAPESEAVSALLSLGYRETEARDAVRGALEDGGSPHHTTSELLRAALKNLSARVGSR